MDAQPAFVEYFVNLVRLRSSIKKSISPAGREGLLDAGLPLRYAPNGKREQRCMVGERAMSDLRLRLPLGRTDRRWGLA